MNKGMSKERLKRVKWASGDKFSQVKWFMSEDCPSQIGSKVENHFQKKVSLHSNEMSVCELPHRFGSKEHLCGSNQICSPQIRWKCPPMFTLQSDWYVAAGEASEERKTQNYREMRALEAFYPSVSVIPPSPSVSPELEVGDYDDTQTPIIPSISTEEEDLIPTESTPCSKSVEIIAPTESIATANEKLPGIFAALDADVSAAASAALTAMLKSNEKGSLVDIDLLIKILNEPKLLEALSKVPNSSTTKKPTLVEPENQPMEPLPSLTIQGPITCRPNATPSTVTSSKWADENPKPFSTYPKPCFDNSSISVSGNPVDSGWDLSRKVLPAIFGSHASSSNLFSRSPQNSRILDLQSFRPSSVSSTKSDDKRLPPETHMFKGSLSSHTIQGPTTSRPNSKACTVTVTSSGRDNETIKRYVTNQTPYSDTCSVSVSSADCKILPASSSSIFVSNSSTSDLLVRPDRSSLQNSQTFDLQSSQPSLVSSTRGETQVLKGSFLSQSSVSTRVTKDVNYYKNLIRLHGTGGNETREQFTAQYQVSAPELTEEGKKPCKFFKSSKGCRNGSTCHFDHISLPNRQAGKFLDNTRSKRLKISNEITG